MQTFITKLNLYLGLIFLLFLVTPFGRKALILTLIKIETLIQQILIHCKIRLWKHSFENIMV